MHLKNVANVPVLEKSEEAEIAFIPAAVAAVGEAVGGLSLSSVAGLAGAGISAVGSIAQGNAAAANARFQAQVAANNATIAQNNAKAAEEAGVIKTEMAGRKEAAIVGGIKAAQAANGVDVNTGSNVDVQQSEREKGRLDEETTMHNANLTAYGYRTQATNFESQAKIDEATASQAQTGGILNATGGLLSKASAISPLWSIGGSGGASAPSISPTDNSLWGNV